LGESKYFLPIEFLGRILYSQLQMNISLIILRIFQLMTYQQIYNWIIFPTIPILPKSDIGEKSYTYFTLVYQSGKVWRCFWWAVTFLTTFLMAWHISDDISEDVVNLREKLIKSNFFWRYFVTAYHKFDGLSQMSSATFF